MAVPNYNSCVLYRLEMTRCQCLKNDGRKCTRMASTKTGDDPLYCWQHQKCQIKSTQIVEKPKKKSTQIVETVSPLPLWRRLTFLSGPISFVFYPNLNGKKILLMGEQHKMLNLCSLNLCPVSKQKKKVCQIYEIHQWLKDLAINA